MFRYLRIAATILCAMFALATVSLWVRSYWQADTLVVPRYGAGRLYVRSNCGVLVYTRHAEMAEFSQRWTVVTVEADPTLAVSRWAKGRFVDWGIGYMQSPQLSAGALPHWVFAAAATLLTAVLSFKLNWRMSLRGLLTVTTLIALALGLIVYSL